MPEIILSATKSDMKAAEDLANAILARQGFDVEVHRYEQNLKIIQENSKLVCDVLAKKERKDEK